MTISELRKLLSQPGKLEIYLCVRIYDGLMQTHDVRVTKTDARNLLKGASGYYEGAYSYVDGILRIGS